MLEGLRCRRRARTGVALLRLRRRLLARVNRRPVSARRHVAPRAHASVALGEPPKHARQPLALCEPMCEACEGIAKAVGQQGVGQPLTRVGQQRVDQLIHLQLTHTLQRLINPLLTRPKRVRQDSV